MSTPHVNHALSIITNDEDVGKHVDISNIQNLIDIEDFCKICRIFKLVCK